MIVDIPEKEAEKNIDDLIDQAWKEFGKPDSVRDQYRAVLHWGGGMLVAIDFVQTEIKNKKE